MHQYTLSRPVPAWNGKRELPPVIHVVQSDPVLAEWELVTVLAGLHGWLCAFDVLIGAVEGTEKDRDLMGLISAFQAYVGRGRMPWSNYTEQDSRNLNLEHQQ